jgi:chromosome segregation ATPase
MNDLKLADLEKRASLLDAREKFISQKEKLLDDSERILKIEVLDKQIEAKEAILNDVQMRIDSLVKTYEHKKAGVDEETRLIGVSVDQMRRKEESLTKVYTQLQHDVGAKRRELNDIKDEITLSKKYAKEQEQVVNKTVNEWNSTLTEFQQEASLIQADKNKISSDIIRLEQEKLSKETELEEVQIKLNSLTEKYEERAASYRKDLKELDNRVSARQDDFDMIEVKNKARLKDVETREKSTRLKEISLMNKERELLQKENRLKMNYELASLNYE